MTSPSSLYSFRLCLLFGAAALVSTLRANDWAPNVTGTALWNSNASHADAAGDKIDSLLINTDLLSTGRFAVGSRNAVLLRGHLAVDWWPRYHGLLRGAAGGRAEWQHTLGKGPLGPVLSLEGTADAVETRESARHGFQLSAAGSLRKRFNDQTRFTFSHQVAWFDADNATFDSGAGHTTLELDRDVTDVARFNLSFGFRDGDVVSYASGVRPDLDALATNQLPVTTFGRPMTAYRVDAKTWRGRLAFIRALDENSALVIAYERRSTERRTLKFDENILSIGLVHQF